ncbi:MAG: ChaB family protein [Candidatus Nanoarchaeia archaeon]
MPYNKKSELPDQVKENLPPHAEEIYKEAYNSAWDQYKDPKKRYGTASREEVAHKVAWSAVKKVYEKNQSGKWVKK